MVPKVEVPTDFGIENLHCQFHGNVLVKLAGEETMRANSVILSFHSSVFVHLFSELKQSTLEMDEFLPALSKVSLPHYTVDKWKWIRLCFGTSTKCLMHLKFHG